MQRCHQRIQPALRLRNCQSRFDSRNRSLKEMIVAYWRRSRRRRKSRCQPNLGVAFLGRSPWIVKARRHNADHTVQIVVKPQTLAQDSRIGSERTLPQAVAQNRFQIKSGRLILGIKRPPQLCFHSQHRKIIWSYIQKADAHRLRCAGKIYVSTTDRRNIFENAGALKIVQFGHGHAHVLRAHARKIILDAHKLLRLGIWQRVQQRGIHNAENRGRRANSNRNRQNGHGAEAGRLAQRTQSVANILHHVFKPYPAPRRPASFLQRGHIAKMPPGRRSRIILRHAGLDLFLLAQFQMQPHLLFEIRVKLSPVNQHAEPSCEFSHPIHIRAPFTPLQSRA